MRFMIILVLLFVSLPVGAVHAAWVEHVNIEQCIDGAALGIVVLDDTEGEITYNVDSSLRQTVIQCSINKIPLDVYYDSDLDRITYARMRREYRSVIGDDIGSALSLAWGIILMTIFFWGVGRG